MALILNIETATTCCSVSLFKEKEMLALRELDEGYTHAENLHLFISGILTELKIPSASLDAISVSRGPGSYTGLRIGASTAKGLAWALDKPLIAIGTLQVMAEKASFLEKKDTIYCPMIDAGRMEVYTALYDSSLKEISPAEALIVNEGSVQQYKKFGPVTFFGNGMPKCRAHLLSLMDSGFYENIMPSAREMGRLALEKYETGQFEELPSFEPFYLKEYQVKAGKGKGRETI